MSDQLIGLIVASICFFLSGFLMAKNIYRCPLHGIYREPTFVLWQGGDKWLLGREARNGFVHFEEATAKAIKALNIKADVLEGLIVGQVLVVRT